MTSPVSADVEALRAALSFNVAVVSNSWGVVDAIPVAGSCDLEARGAARSLATTVASAGGT